MDSWLPLANALTVLETKHGVRLYASNLTARRRSGQGSLLDQLASQGLARSVVRGKRHYWELSTKAFPKLLELAAAARPGLPPGNQVTLDAHQVLVFLTFLRRQADPIGALGDALFAATGIREGVERVVIPLSPRKPLV